MILDIGGYPVEIDDEDHFKVINISLSIGRYSNDTPYVRQLYRETGNKSIKELSLPKILLGISDNSVIVDHIDGNTMNNKKANLRMCTQKENCRNSKKAYNRITSSTYKGVSLRKDKKNLKRPWRAYIRLDGKLIGLGHYDNEIDAAKAYDRAAVHHFGEFAKINFEKGKICES